MIPDLKRELWLASRIGMGVFAGTTTIEVRRERMRQEILRKGMASVVAGRGKSGRRTYGELFASVYGEPLVRAEKAA